MESCIFCRIAAGQTPAKVLIADDDVVAFEDAFPKAPVHLLVVPRRHLASLAEAAPEDEALLGKLLHTAAEAARRSGIAAGGFRVVVNTGAGAGQSVFHLHLHVLGGRRFGWPPG
ncbi:MAG: histidine triad nucleotide-binding protein [Acidobacteriota bacterium]